MSEIKFIATGNEIRTGTLPDPIIKKNNSFSGAITAPFDFFDGKYNDNESHDFPYDGMLVTYSMKNRKIIFIENNTTDEGGTTVTGTLNLNDTLENIFHINKGKIFTSKELANVINMNRSLFFDKEQAFEMVSKLRGFNAQISGEIVNKNDNQGSKQIGMSQLTTTNIDLKFILNCNIFSHETEKRKFLVDIGFDVRDKQVDFWLESVELKEFIDESTNTLIIEQLTLFNDLTAIQLD